MLARALLLTVVFLLVCGRASAQSTEYRFMKLNANDGLSNNQVTCFLKDSRGFMWFGTISGLNRYDGRNVRVFLNDMRDSTSLLNNNVIKLFEDPDGKIWVTTIEGTTIYDPHKENFIRNTISYVQRFALPDASVTDIIRDKKGNYWFVHDTQGLYRYQPGSKSVAKKTTRIVFAKGNQTENNQIASIKEDKRGHIWVVHKNGTLDRLRADGRKLLARNTFLKNRNKAQQLLYNCAIDRDGDLWLYVLRANQGVFYLNAKTNSFKKIGEKKGNSRLNSNIIQGIVEDNRGLIWIGTDHGGINILDKKTWKITYLLHDEDNNKSLSQNTINSLYKDNSGIIWTGTYKDGINYHHENIFRFTLYENNRSKPESLPYNDFNRFAEDEKGNLWLGGNGGGLIYFDRTKNTYTSYVSKPGDPNSLGSDVIVSLLIDRDKKLWVGTYYGGLSCFDGKNFKSYRNKPSDKNSISDDSIWELFEDSRGYIWIGTLDGGLDRSRISPVERRIPYMPAM